MFLVARLLLLKVSPFPEMDLEKFPDRASGPLIYSLRTRTWVNCCLSPGSGGSAADTDTGRSGTRSTRPAPTPQPASDAPGCGSAHTRARGKGPLVLTVQNNSILPTSEKKNHCEK